MREPRRWSCWFATWSSRRSCRAWKSPDTSSGTSLSEDVEPSSRRPARPVDSGDSGDSSVTPERTGWRHGGHGDSRRLPAGWPQLALYESALALILSNSSWVMVPASSSSLAWAISARNPGRLAHVLIELPLLRLGLSHGALAHPVALGNQVASTPRKGSTITNTTHAALAPAADVVAAEEVDEYGDDNPDPGHPAEEEDHRPEDSRNW
jgi:hypothetical protein